MPAVVFSTSGLIDLRAFTVMGFNAKPTKPNPIGFFGTGLKYAMAVLCRMGAQPVVYVGKDKYTFFTKTVDFRGKSFEQIWMRSEKWKLRARNIQLPYTTEYGKNWKPWMVFRELESNTRDEGGVTYLVADDDMDVGIDIDEDHTVIVVDGDWLVEAYNARDTLFVSDDSNPILAADHMVKVRSGGNKQLYYRGIRAKETHKPALFTYDFAGNTSLTEDRTFETEYYVRSDLASFVASGCEDEKVIEAIITAKPDNWEHGLEIPSYVRPSDAFKAVMARNPRGISSAIHSYYGRHVESKERKDFSPWRDTPRPWVLKDRYIDDAAGNTLFVMPSDYAYGVWEKLANELLSFANGPKLEPLLTIVSEDGEAVQEVHDLAELTDIVAFDASEASGVPNDELSCGALSIPLVGDYNADEVPF